MKNVTRVERNAPVVARKKRVAAYARVSMETERLQHSLSAQVSYYNAMIQKNPNWIYAWVYADKALILLVVLLAALLDHAVSISADIEFAAVAGATCLWFIASEGMSILENASLMGVKIPKILLQALELFKGKGGGDHPSDGNGEE